MDLLGSKMTDAAQVRWHGQLRECSLAVADGMGVAPEVEPATRFDWRHWTVKASVRPVAPCAGDAGADGKKRSRPTPTPQEGAAASSDDDAELLGVRSVSAPEVEESVRPVGLVTEVTLLDSRLAFGDGDASAQHAQLPANVRPGTFDLVLLRDVFDQGTDAATAQEVVRAARRFCVAEGDSPGGALVVQQSDAADPYQYMLPQVVRKATDAATPAAINLVQRSLGIRSIGLPLAFQDLERLLLLPPESPAGARIPSASATGETIPEFLGVYRVPRSVLGTVLAVPPVL
jgi:hypothetical protein